MRTGGIEQDVRQYCKKISIPLSDFWGLLFLLHTNRYFRVLFYHRIGPVFASLISWYRPGDRYFVLSKTTLLAPGAYCIHPYSTIINAESIGFNFSCRHLTTIGNKSDIESEKRPTLGNNVSLGVAVTIIGSIHIGNNVTIGAGSVVVNDIPDNCVVVGNPARIIVKDGVRL